MNDFLLIYSSIYLLIWMCCLALYAINQTSVKSGARNQKPETRNQKPETSGSLARLAAGMYTAERRHEQYGDRGVGARVSEGGGGGFAVGGRYRSGGTIVAVAAVVGSASRRESVCAVAALG